MSLLFLAVRSLKSRWLGATLVTLSIALSLFLILSIERIRASSENSFSNALSGADLVVGARGSDLQLLLYTVFHMGEATGNISYESYQHFAKHPATAWTIPISLGDSHQGFRVVATDENFYQHFQFHGNQRPEFSEGQSPTDVFDVVLGSEVARKLGYKRNSKIVLSHGIAELSLQEHSDKPFTVSGILKNTGTPIDRALFINLQGMEAIHVDWENGAPPSAGNEKSAQNIREMKLEPKQITSFILRTKNRVLALRLQREIFTYNGEPLMAAVPGIVLSKLWENLDYASGALRAISACVALVSLLGLFLSLYLSLKERRREMSIFRSLGLGSWHITFLLIFESLLLGIMGCFLGVTSLFLSLQFTKNWLLQNFGLYLEMSTFSLFEVKIMSILLIGCVIAGLLPALMAYRKNLGEDLSTRL